ncbi:tRNA-dihydrouridine synthase B, partial [Alteromonadales bacterium TW-7]
RFTVSQWARELLANMYLWYLQTHDSDGQFRRVFNALDNSEAQVVALEQYFKTLAAN